MACLGSVAYDPATQVTSASTTALLAMTAFDTTNARITFTTPPNGRVFVRIRAVIHGANTTPQTLLGVLEGSTVIGRIAPISGRGPQSVNALQVQEASFVVSGLTPGSVHVWDAAYGVEFAVAATAYKWGGPDNATANDATGALCFEVWECTNVLAATLYDPATAVTNKALTATQAMTAFDTANLRLSFVPPLSGRVLVRAMYMSSGGTAGNGHLFGVLDGTTVRARTSPTGGINEVGSIVATSHNVWEAKAVIANLNPAIQYTWDAAWGVEFVTASSNIKYGGPNNTTQDDAFGGFAYEIWGA